MTRWKFLLGGVLFSTFAVQPPLASQGGNVIEVVTADASMATFEKAPAAAQFMSKIDTSKLRMKRYQSQRSGWPAP
jgi:hypothetical protein